MDTTSTTPAIVRTAADVKVGDRVRAVNLYEPLSWPGAREPFEFVVRAVDVDEHGVYLNQREGMLIFRQYASTVTHHIEVIERGGRLDAS